MTEGSKRKLRLAALIAFMFLSGTCHAASSLFYGMTTYTLLKELQATSGPALSSSAFIGNVARAAAALDLSRSTRLPDGRMLCTLPITNVSAETFHAFAPRSYKYLPTKYLRDYVRSVLVGVALAVNDIFADPAKNADVKAAALGQYIHLVQSIHLNQTGAKPIEVGPVESMMEQLRAAAPARGAAVPDDVLRAFATTRAVLRTWAETGKVPDFKATDEFERTFYEPLSARQKGDLVRMLQQQGLSRYLEAVAREVVQDRADDAPEEAYARVVATLAESWRLAHPQDPGGFTPPDLRAASVGAVDYDVHPDLLIPDSLMTSGLDARTPIDEEALVQQALDKVRAETARLETVTKSETIPARQQRLKLVLEALRVNEAQGRSALGRPSPRSASGERETAIAKALSALDRSLQDVVRVNDDLGLTPDRVTAQDLPCPTSSPLATAAAEDRLDNLFTSIAALAAESVDALAEPQRAACRKTAYAASVSRLKGGTVVVPPGCGPVVVLNSALLQRYAVSHVDRRDPLIENMLTNVLQQTSTFQPRR